MKKLAALMILLSLTVFTIGCGGGEEAADDTGTDTTSDTSGDDAAAPAGDPRAEDGSGEG